ncbi:cytochrome c biogenesis protein [Siminovitchia sp. 179-K 8D1 HS]|uniref:cytochrome c biogenesis protein n=1 Tax=Siminovitchia sp. 179-K 8D1 HS TaxID=3142385 RepID=UPI0039A1FBAF
MIEFILARLPEVVIVIYAISILLYFIDFVQQNREASRLAFRLLSIVWILQTIFLFIYMYHAGRFPVLTLFEGLYFYTWVLVTLSLGIQKIFQVDFTVFFTNIIGFIFMAIHAFAPAQSFAVSAEQLMSELLFIHITMAILSYGAFSISFVFSMLYLFQYNLLKRKKWRKKLWRITDLAKLEKSSFALNVIGVPMLLLSVILGLRWAVMKLSVFHWYDPKIIGSFALLGIYGFILYLHMKKQLYGRKLALWNTAAFLLVLINFFLNSRLSTFHYWDS